MRLKEGWFVTLRLTASTVAMGLMNELLPHSGLQRPRFRRRGSKDSSRSRSGGESDEEGPNPTPNVDALLDDSMPEDYFKQDTLRLIHGLRIHNWNSVLSTMSEHIEIDRISGALTNAVYKVSPPSYIKERIKNEHEGRPYHHRLPMPLLLRVYGPQVGVLIDREKELKIVEKLTRHNIGAKLLGTFTNGRFEQFLNAKPLTKEDLRNPETSIQIAKRFRDLHDHLSLSKEQLEEGPAVFDKYSKWKESFTSRVKELSADNPGYIEELLGSDLETFFKAVESYKAHLLKTHSSSYFKELAFCHNDAQYGNILKVEPPKGSPLLMPQHEHKRLVVIDFEYAGQNNRAYDIANHFCEWMHDYHHPSTPHHIWLDRYPSHEEQIRFLSSYVEHNASVLDESVIEPKIEELHREVSQWLPAVSIHWGMWGVIQAPKDVEEKLEIIDKELATTSGYEFQKWTQAIEQKPEIVNELTDEVFDYLAYSKEKFALFWRDLKALS